MELTAQARLNEHLMRWDQEIRDFDTAIHNYGERKADHEYQRAVVKEKAKADDPKIAGNRLETIADADPEAYRLHKEFRAAESTIEAKKARLRWAAAVADALRSEIATDRAVSLLHADNRGTP